MTQPTSPYWSIALGSPGNIVAGANDIEQSLRIIVGTQRGAVPLMPEFGIDRTILDQPMDIAAPRFIAQVVAAIDAWEPRCTVEEVSYALNEEGQMVLVLTWTSPISPAALQTSILARNAT